MKGFYIEVTNNLLDPKHRKKMGSSVWEFMWCLDKITRVDKDSVGWVLDGIPINLKHIKEDIGITENHISKNLIKLKKEGYINVKRTPYGLIISVNKAKKRFNQKVDTDSTKRVNLKAQKGESNITRQTDKTIPKGSNPVASLRSYFINAVKKEKSFEPEMSFGKEGKLLKDKLQRYSFEQLKDLMNKFLNSQVGENLGYTLSICLSASVINQWLAGKLEKPKKPTYNGNPMRKMFGKWQVLENSQWLEFAGLESEIVFQ